MVARDGIEQHYTEFVLPADGIILDPRLESWKCGG